MERTGFDAFREDVWAVRRGFHSFVNDSDSQTLLNTLLPWESRKGSPTEFLAARMEPHLRRPVTEETIGEVLDSLGLRKRDRSLSYFADRGVIRAHFIAGYYEAELRGFHSPKDWGLPERRLYEPAPLSHGIAIKMTEDGAGTSRLASFLVLHEPDALTAAVASIRAQLNRGLLHYDSDLLQALRHDRPSTGGSSEYWRRYYRAYHQWTAEEGRIGREDIVRLPDGVFFAPSPNVAGAIRVFAKTHEEVEPLAWLSQQALRPSFRVAHLEVVSQRRKEGAIAYPLGFIADLLADATK